MKKLAMILLMTFNGMVAQAAPFDTPMEFADFHCGNTDDGETCRAEIEADRSTQTMNHYSIAIRICSTKNVRQAWNRSTCLVKAAKAMRDREFTQKITDCRHDENFWGNAPKNESWAEVADCQSRVFGKRAGDIDRKTSRNSSGNSTNLYTGQ